MDDCKRLNRTARTVAAIFVLMCTGYALSGCGASDDRYAKVLVGTWGSREVAPDDVIVESQFTLLPGGRVNWQGQVRLLVPPDFYLRPDRPNFEVRNGRLIYYFTANGTWAVREGYLHTRIEFSTLTSLMPVGFATAWKLKEVNSKEMIYVSAANGRTRVEYRKSD
jgi:hypothetical protein